MKDSAGQPIEVGDYAFAVLNGKNNFYSFKDRIVRFTPKGMAVFEGGARAWTYVKIAPPE